MDRVPEDSVPVSAAFGTLIRGVTADASARIVGVEMGEIAALGAQLHRLRGGAITFYGEAMVAAALLSAQIKGDERLTVQIQSEEPDIGFVADIRADGGTRGRLNSSYLREGDSERFQGVLLAIKSIANRELYRGVTAIDDQSIADALSTHLSDSQQVKSALAIHVAPGEDGALVARGLLVEGLPGGAASRDLGDVNQIHAAVAAADFEATLRRLCTGDERTVLGHQALFWQCQCSQERVETVIKMLGAEALGEMIADGEETSITCHFCNTTRTVSVSRLREILASCDG